MHIKKIENESLKMVNIIRFYSSVSTRLTHLQIMPRHCIFFPHFLEQFLRLEYSHICVYSKDNLHILYICLQIYTSSFFSATFCRIFAYLPIAFCQLVCIKYILGLFISAAVTQAFLFVKYLYK